MAARSQLSSLAPLPTSAEPGGHRDGCARYRDKQPTTRVSGTVRGKRSITAHSQGGAFVTITDVETITAQLELIADWRGELVRKLRRAALLFELCGIDAPQRERRQ